MAKGKSDLIGLTEGWRPGLSHDAYRVQVFKNDVATWISAKTHPKLKEINSYLRAQKLRKDRALSDNHFQGLRSNLIQNLKSEFGLKSYKAKEQVELKRKKFDFADSVDEFIKYKSDTAIPMLYKGILINFWFPFFIGKGCEHPVDFSQWKMQAVNHVKTAKKLNSNERYAVESYRNLCSALNEYLKFLAVFKYLNEDQVFEIRVPVSLESQKRGLTKSSKSRTEETYELQDLFNIKKKIDETYSTPDVLEWKLRAYSMLFGICTGLRRGNLLGLYVEDLYPENEVPHFETRDNVVPGWSRGETSKVVLLNSTKTSVGRYRLPFIQPSVEFLVEITTFIKNHMHPESRLLDCHPDTVATWWFRISKECGFKYLHPHAWRHTYATIGAEYLSEYYDGDIRFLRDCCMHSKLETTESYIRKKHDDLLKRVKKIKA